MTIGVKMFSCRLLLAVGGGLNALSHIISGITTDIRVFYFSHGLLGGNLTRCHCPNKSSLASSKF